MNWKGVEKLALALPGTEASTSYGRPAVGVRNKVFVCTGKADDHFVLMAPLDEVDMLIDTDPDTFFQTDHYRGWPTILVRHASADPERIEALVERAWWGRASPKQRAEHATPSA